MGGRFLAWVARGRMLLRNMVLAWRRHDGLLKSVKSFSCAGEGGAAGLRPAPAVVPAAGRQQPKPKPKRLWVSAGLAGRCGLAGHAVNPSMGARWRHPWRQRSCQPTSPHPRQFPGDGWIGPGITRGHGVRSVFRWKTDLIPIDFVIRQRLIHAWRGSTADREKLSKAGWVRLRGREPHGPEACLGRVGQDAQPRSCRVRRTAHTSKRRPSLHGRTCSGPRNRTHPASPQEISCCCCSSSERVQGAALPNPPSHAAPQNAFG